MSNKSGNTRPVIGVTSSRRGANTMWWFNCLALWRAGAAPQRLVAGREFDPGRLDGLVIGGGDDIDAEIYGQKIALDIRIDPERDRLELSLLEHAMERELPVLGICRGAQMLNVYLGGTLHTDIYEIYEKAPRLRTVLPKKTVRIDERSKLFSILGQSTCRVNSLHHQSIDKTGRGLDVVSRDEQGIVQGIEDPERPYLIGVQWHPEFLVFQQSQQRLFVNLAAACASRAGL